MDHRFVQHFATVSSSGREDADNGLNVKRRIAAPEGCKMGCPGRRVRIPSGGSAIYIPVSQFWSSCPVKKPADNYLAEEIGMVCRDQKEQKNNARARNRTWNLIIELFFLLVMRSTIEPLGLNPRKKVG